VCHNNEIMRVLYKFISSVKKDSDGYRRGSGRPCPPPKFLKTNKDIVLIEIYTFLLLYSNFIYDMSS